MSKWIDQVIVQLIRQRGCSCIWELAAAAALWPYIVAPALPGWSRFDIVDAPTTAAISLLVTMILLAVLRRALAAQQLNDPLGWPLSSAGTQTNAPSRATAVRQNQEPPTTSGLPDRKALESLIAEHDGLTPAALGILQFTNYAPMLSFDQPAALRVVAEFGRRLKAAARRRTVAQVSEDTFGIWFADGTTSAAKGELAAIVYVMAQEISDEGLTVAPDIRLGLAASTGQTENPGALVSQAVATVAPLKRFNHARAGRTSGASLNEAEHQARRFALEQALRRAVQQGELSLRYQPLVDAAAGRLTGAEVLLRWRHPVFGDVSPSTFVPILEQTGLIHEIGLWTLNSACRQLSEWRRSGQLDIRLAINLSAIQLQNPDLKNIVARVVASHGLEPSHVELELTETAAMEDQARSVVLFDELRKMGFGIALDDFGSGHSNLGYLKNLPFTKLKIDREFVSNVDTQPGSQAICKALIELGAGLGISVLAEGVERYEEVTTLRRLGCHQFQGYYFARPLTADDFARTCTDRGWQSLIASEVHRGRAELSRRLAP